MNDATLFLALVAALALALRIAYHLINDLVGLYITVTTWLWPDDAYHTLPADLFDETGEVWG